MPMFDTVSEPELERVPPESIVIPIPPEFDRIKLTPVGMVRASPSETVMPLVIVHVAIPFHVPLNVEAHVESLTVPPTACTVCVGARRIIAAVDRMHSSISGKHGLPYGKRSVQG